ncbi:MAG: hypothetical protein LQ340_002767 [Diploschistes diacapsis]|nr:MAG: hypothetical protein LQ340_002767 [Diploschistes diacapsis]
MMDRRRPAQLERKVEGIDEAIDQSRDESIIRVFDEPSLKLLSHGGYEVEDVVTWAWIVTADDSFQAALRLLAASNHAQGLCQAPVPTFVFLFILRRARVTAQALKLLIAHGWDRLENRINPQWLAAAVSATSGLESRSTELSANRHADSFTTAKYPVMSEQTIVLMVIRLLRHAGRCWPAAIPAITQMLTTHIIGASSKNPTNSDALSVPVLGRLTFLFNRLLRLIARPTSSDPFLAIVHQERAQFNIIRKMTEFQPALIVNQEGYRAIIQVQIAHRKTLSERNWSYLKSKAWPPWREDKLGIDAGKGRDMGISRATRALQNLKESGYSSGPWEDAAGILSGWDTDRSPTIQKRTIFSPGIGFRFIENVKIEDGPFKSLVWEARIRATRTIDEAWASFLIYQEEAGVYPNVYTAMLEKIAFEEKRIQGLEADEPMLQTSRVPESSLASGDMLEVETPSTNPREMTYTRTSPPEFSNFVKMIMDRGIVPSGRLLSLLIRHANSIDTGFNYLLASKLSPASCASLLGTGKIDATILIDVPRSVFCAFIALLVQFPHAQVPRSVARDASTECIPLPRPAIAHAIDLVLAAKPPYLNPWNTLLSALAQKNLHLSQLHHNYVVNKDVDRWAAMISIVDKMVEAEVEVGFSTFHILCAKYEKMCRDTRAWDKDSRREGAMGVDENIGQDVFAIFMKQGLAKLKAIFKNLVSLDLGTPEPPSSEDTAASENAAERNKSYSSPFLLEGLLHIPNPPQIHAFMRALGAARDDAGIVNLLRWMAFASHELEVVTSELGNGPRQFRLALIAARVHLERSWTQADEEDAGIHAEGAAHEDLLNEAKRIVESVDNWNGWARDDEVFEYCRKGHWRF